MEGKRQRGREVWRERGMEEECFWYIKLESKDRDILLQIKPLFFIFQSRFYHKHLFYNISFLSPESSSWKFRGTRIYMYIYEFTRLSDFHNIFFLLIDL